MFNFETIFPILFWGGLGFLAIKAILVTFWLGFEDVEGGVVIVAWVTLILGSIPLIAVYFLGGWLSTSTGICLTIFFVLYIPASIFFAKKHGSMLGLYITKTFEGSRPMAFPLGYSEIFLVVLLLVAACLAQSRPGTGWLVAAFLLMAGSPLLGTWWYEETSFSLWLGKLEIQEKKPEKQSSRKRAGWQFAGILVHIFDRMGVAVSYVGLPVLLTLSLRKPAVWAWGACAVSLTGYTAPQVYYRARKRSLLRAVKKDFAKLKQAETSKEIQTIVVALSNRHINAVASAALERLFAANPAIVDDLLEILKSEKSDWHLAHFLWFTAAKGVYNGGAYKLDHACAERLVALLHEQSIPVEKRAQLLKLMVKDKGFFRTSMLQERLPELMSDYDLMNQLRSEYGIRLKRK